MTESYHPVQTIMRLLNEGGVIELTEFIESLTPSETARTISRLTDKDRLRLLELLSPEDAAIIIEEISNTQAADLVEAIPIKQAAAIMEEMHSDHQADILGEMESETSQAILAAMHSEDADEARELMQYDPDCAGGIMISEYLVYRTDNTIEDVLDDLRKHREKYANFHIQYFYVVDGKGSLAGVLRINDVLFPASNAFLKDMMLSSPLSVPATATLRELEEFFHEHHLFGVPVLDPKQRLVGVVLPAALKTAEEKRNTRSFLRLSGIIGGEEFRTMPLMSRSGRRLAWLSLNILLNIVAASVIALYQDTLAAVIALAVFLPMVSDMSGCSGNQAVAVSMRELSLGLVRPSELFWVLIKEVKVGLINGLVLGIMIGVVALIWMGNPWFGLVVGGALAANTILSVSLGGLLPLILKRMNLDPALVSSPILTTVTDMAGFFFVLSFATALMPRLLNG